MTVSVVIPLYNKVRYIKRTLDSVLAQTYTKFELLVVDDGSTDGSDDIVRGYADPRIRVIVQPNAGPGAARNNGMRHASCDIIAFLDADDVWLPTFLERSVALLEANPECAMTVSGYRMRSQARAVRELYIHSGVWTISETTRPQKLVEMLNACMGPCALCRKSIVERYGGFYTKDRCTLGEDSYLWLQVLMNHAIYRMPDALVIYDDEASELGINRKGIRPLTPVVTDQEQLFVNCPARYHALLKKSIALCAVAIARRYARDGHVSLARNTLKLVGRTDGVGIEYAKARIECLPGVWAIVTSRAFLRAYRWFRQIVK